LRLIDPGVYLRAIVAFTRLGRLELLQCLAGLGEHLPGIAPPHLNVAGQGMEAGRDHAPQPADLIVFHLLESGPGLIERIGCVLVAPEAGQRPGMKQRDHDFARIGAVVTEAVLGELRGLDEPAVPVGQFALRGPDPGAGAVVIGVLGAHPTGPRMRVGGPVKAHVAGHPGEQPAHLGGDQVQLPGLDGLLMSPQPSEHPVPQQPGLQQQRIRRRVLVIAGQPPHVRGVMLQRGLSDVRRVSPLPEVQRLLRDHGHQEIG
jgi:hypothetical protein